MMTKNSFLAIMLSLSVIEAQVDKNNKGNEVFSDSAFNTSVATGININENNGSSVSSDTDGFKSNSVKTESEKIFKPGEAIIVKMYPDTTSFLNGFFKIDQFGNIEYPIMGTLCIKDMTKKQLIDTIQKECADYIRYPNIHIEPLIRVSLFGGFYRPGLQWVNNRSSLWDVIYLAGGVQREDGLKKIRWERDGEIISKNLIADFQAGSSLSEIGIKSGDQLCVTARPKQTFGQGFRDNFMPLFTILMTTATTALSAYQTYKIITEDN